MNREESPLDIAGLLKMKLLFSNDTNNNLYDTSISHQLKVLRKEFSKNLYIKKI